MISATSRAILVLSILVCGAACATTANAAPPGDACALLTPAQVGAALGVPVAAGTYVTPTFKKTCTWNATTAGSGYVTLMLQDVGAFESGKQLSSMAAATKMVVTPIGGVGDDAYYLALGDQVGFIVKKGNATFKVAVYAHIPIESKQAKEKTLAQQVVSGLQQ
jgi:hypothetical protein